MVDTSDKPVTHRVATASGRVSMQPDTLRMILDRKVVKGDVLEVARLAGIMAAKRTGDLIPLCHPLPLTAISVDLAVDGESAIRITATVKTHARTGVEMEALAAVAVAGLTVYDMVKASDRSVVIGDIRLDEKTGGVHGSWRRDS